MNNVSTLSECDLLSVHGGTNGEDSMARDLGQYVGGVARGYMDHPFLSFLPIYGQVLVISYGINAMTQ